MTRLPVDLLFALALAALATPSACEPPTQADATAGQPDATAEQPDATAEQPDATARQPETLPRADEMPSRVETIPGTHFAATYDGARAHELQRRLMAPVEKPSAEDGDRTLSPYFFVPGGDPETDRLPLESTRAEVQIAGVIARVKVSQVYKNEGDRTLEAVYVFPASTRAAVYAMKMTIGDRTVVAKIEEREKARQDYEQAKREGRTASLLEQQRPNVFQMNLAHILPGDRIEVELEYTELLVPRAGIYEFVYPTVVGPRYTEQKAGDPNAERWQQNPHLEAGKPAPFTFGLQAAIRSGTPIAGVSCPSHEVKVGFPDARQAEISLEPGRAAGTRDVVLRYSLAGEKIETGLLLYPGEDERFFLLMMEPPERVGRADVLPREYIFIVDVSGSMRGFPLDTAKSLMRDLLRDVSADEFFNLMAFSGGSAVLSEERSLLGTRQNVQKGLDFLDGMQGGGGTRMLQAVERALAMPHREGTSRIFVVITDGYVMVEKELFELIRTKRAEANFFAFGIGRSVNRYLVEGLARAGMGEPLIVLGPDEVEKKAAWFRDYISRPVMQGIRVTFEGFDAYDVEPESVPDLFAARPVTVFGKYRGEPAGRIAVSGHVPGEKLRGVCDVADGNLSADNAALRTLWARHRVQRISDMHKIARGDPREKEVLALGLKYHLMTDYTSFVAIDSQVRARPGEEPTRVRQPLPMPQGVPDTAIRNLSGVRRRARIHGIYDSEGLLRGGMAGRGRGGVHFKSPPGKSEAGRRVLPPARVSMLKFRVDGRLDPKRAKKMIQSRLKHFSSCYEKTRLFVSGPFTGRVELELRIGPDGRVKQVEIVKNTFKPKDKAASISACLRKICERLRFPPFKGAGAELGFSIIFR
ncbi:MAG: VWA domain-containing protein [Deltaproteobacteria bacterium]|nr:VWA domain-containing protein [Deltaproteobacteria bacterium]